MAEVTWIEGTCVCDNCGAFSESEETIPHYLTCKVGESKNWEKTYNDQPSQEEQNLDDKKYEEYLKKADTDVLYNEIL